MKIARKLFSKTFKLEILLLLSAYLCCSVTSTVIINKQYQNLKVMQSFSSVIEDRNLIQCYINQKFHNNSKACSEVKKVEEQGRKLSSILNDAHEYPSCRRTQFKEEIKKCKAKLCSLFKNYLRYDMSSKKERKLYSQLISHLAKYVLVLKEDKQQGKLHENPETDIRDFIDDQIYKMSHKPETQKINLKPVLKSSPMFGKPKELSNVSVLKPKKKRGFSFGSKEED